MKLIDLKALTCHTRIFENVLKPLSDGLSAHQDALRRYTDRFLGEKRGQAGAIILPQSSFELQV